MRWMVFCTCLLLGASTVEVATAAPRGAEVEAHGRRKKNKRPGKNHKKRQKRQEKKAEGEHPKPPPHKGISF